VSNVVGEFLTGINGYHEKMKNERFLLEVPKTGVNKDGYHAVVIQLMKQQTEWPRWEKNPPCIFFDVYKVDGIEKRNKMTWMCISELTPNIICPPNTSKYFGGSEMCQKHMLEPGQYIIHPSLHAKIDRKRCLLVTARSTTQLTCSKYTETNHLFIRKAATVLNTSNRTFNLDGNVLQFGEWVKGKNAGGQIGNQEKFATNPQYSITVTGNSDVPFLFDLLQETVEPMFAIGCTMLKIPSTEDLPASYRYLLDNNRRSAVLTIDGKEMPFWSSIESSGYYMLKPGNYVAVLFTNNTNEQKKYALFAAWSKQMPVNVRQVQ